MTAIPALRADLEVEPQRPREYGLDWLRVIAFVILIGFHSGMYFVPWPWHVKNPRTSEWLTWVMSAFHVWRLPLLFFVSGAGTWFNLARRGKGPFALERLTRLGVPLLFGTLVVCPPQIYVERLVSGQRYASYLEFWGTVFTKGFYPQGNMTWTHLWFVGYALTYSLLALPLLGFLRGRTGRALVERLARACERPGVVYLLHLPAAAAAAYLVPRWPRTYTLVADWANFTTSLLFFLAGFVVCGSERFLALVERKRHELGAVAAALGALLYALGIAAALGVPASPSLELVRLVAESYVAMVIILALVGYARVHLNRDSPTLRSASRAVYPFYIVHQTVTILLGWAWLDWDLPFAVKFPMLCAGTFLGSWAVYELVRRTRVTRILFGMRA